jgi:tonB-dependent receptor
MKSGKCLLMLLMILFSPMAFAQQSGVNVTGSVVEQGSDTPIEQATVRLLNVKDSAMVRGVVSARNGSFTLKKRKERKLFTTHHIHRIRSIVPTLANHRKEKSRKRR